MHWSGDPTPIVTGKDGGFDFTVSPLPHQYDLYAENDGFTKGKAEILNRDIPRLTPEKAAEVNWALYPLVKVRGDVLDADTNLPPLVHIGLIANRVNSVSKQEAVKTSEDAPAASMKADGTFEIQVGTGNHQWDAHSWLWLTYGCMRSTSDSSPYRLEKPVKFNIGPKGSNDIHIRFKKNSGILLRLEIPQNQVLRILPDIEVRTPDGKISGRGFGDPFFIPTAKWGDVVEVRVNDFQTEYIPWTRVVADAKTWPITLKSSTK